MKTLTLLALIAVTSGCAALGQPNFWNGAQIQAQMEQERQAAQAAYWENYRKCMEDDTSGNAALASLECSGDIHE
jgi:hypothetical protein